jgi:hypothetical protein
MQIIRLGSDYSQRVPCKMKKQILNTLVKLKECYGTRRLGKRT